MALLILVLVMSPLLQSMEEAKGLDNRFQPRKLGSTGLGLNVTGMITAVPFSFKVPKEVTVTLPDIFPMPLAGPAVEALP